MKTAAQVEIDIMHLSATERARLAMVAWDSIEDDATFAASHSLDPEGIALAIERDNQMNVSDADSLTLDQFKDRTGGSRG